MRVSLRLGALLMASAGALLADVACAENGSSFWSPVNPTIGCPGFPSGFPVPTTWVLPEPPNEPTTPPGDEPPGFIVFVNRTFAVTPQYYTIADAIGAGTSDWVIFGNGLLDAPPTQAQVLFYSDPENPSNPSDPYFLPAFGTFHNDGILCVENTTGCVASFSVPTTIGTNIVVTAASDGETFFDPFGAGFNTSDGSAFNETPEPSFLLLTGGLLLAVFSVRRWTGPERTK